MSKIKIIVSDVRLILFMSALILITVFLVQNTGTTQVNFLVTETQIPTAILILVAILVGFFGGYLFALWFRRQQKRDSPVQE